MRHVVDISHRMIQPIPELASISNITMAVVVLYSQSRSLWRMAMLTPVIRASSPARAGII